MIKRHGERTFVCAVKDALRRRTLHGGAVKMDEAVQVGVFTVPESSIEKRCCCEEQQEFQQKPEF